MGLTKTSSQLSVQATVGSQRVISAQARKRAHMLSAAINTWSERGYAHLSVRSVAERSRFSHGMVHYYFTGMDDLVAACVGLVQQGMVLDEGDTIRAATDALSLTGALSNALVRSLIEHADLHRVRYDLRNQAMFEVHLRHHAENVQTAWEDQLTVIHQRLAGYGILDLRPAWVMNAHIDGIFHAALRKYSLGNSAAIDILRGDLDDMFQAMTTTAVPVAS